MYKIDPVLEIKLQAFPPFLLAHDKLYKSN